tara:strand:- start:148 stop:348 length:201 start_codon:yes stop_codon:yes gene_type:complete
MIFLYTYLVNKCPLRVIKSTDATGVQTHFWGCTWAANIVWLAAMAFEEAKGNWWMTVFILLEALLE